MTSPRRAVIIIDVQEEYFSGMLKIQHPPKAISEPNIIRVIKAAQQENLPIINVQHQKSAAAPIFAQGSPSWMVRPSVAQLETDNWLKTTKTVASVLADASVINWLKARQVDTLTLVGYMANNCILATAMAAEPLVLKVEVLFDATGSIHLANAMGKINAQQLHEALMILLNSNLAAVSDTDTWLAAVAQQTTIQGSNLLASVAAGNEEYLRG